MRVFDAVVIGAGPAGLSAAVELAAAGSVLQVDQGPAADRRERVSPDDVLSGVGGAGLFSDGKHSFFPSATALWKLPGVAPAFERTAALLRTYGVEAAPIGEPSAEVAAGTWHAKPYPSSYLGFAARLAMIEALWAAGGQRQSGTRVTEVVRDGADLVVALERAGVAERVRTRHVVIATGRWSARWIRPWLVPLGVTYAFQRVEFGVRLEAASHHPMFARLPGVDGKLRYIDPASHSEIRTFCTCREGEVIVGHADGIRAFSGRADGPPTGQSNVGLLVRTYHQRFGRDVLRYVDRASPTSLPLTNWLARPTLLDPVFGTAGTLAIVHAVKRFATWAPELDHGVLVHAPAVEGIGDYPVVDDALAAAPGVWIAGDAGGQFRGIVASMVSGRHVASRILASR